MTHCWKWLEVILDSVEMASRNFSDIGGTSVLLLKQIIKI